MNTVARTVASGVLALLVVAVGAVIGFRFVDGRLHESTPVDCLLPSRTEVVQSKGLLVPARLPVPESACKAGVFLKFLGRSTPGTSTARWESGYFATPDQEATDGTTFMELFQRDADRGQFGASFCSSAVKRFERVVGDQRIAICVHGRLSPRLQEYWEDVPFTADTSEVNWIDRASG